MLSFSKGAKAYGGVTNGLAHYPCRTSEHFIAKVLSPHMYSPEEAAAKRNILLKEMHFFVFLTSIGLDDPL